MKKFSSRAAFQQGQVSLCTICTTKDRIIGYDAIFGTTQLQLVQHEVI